MTTRLAIISDIHSDFQALDAALLQIAKLNCDEIICLGDVVDYGDHPAEVIARLRERAIPTLHGNHEAWVARDGHDDQKRKLSDDALAWLASLPTHLSRTVDGVRVAFWHARPRSHMDGIYAGLPSSDAERLLEKAEADVLVVGHTHIPLAVDVAGGRKIVNPGALLRLTTAVVGGADGVMLYDVELKKFVPAPVPRVGGTFGVLELPSRKFTIVAAAGGGVVEIG